MGIIGVLWGIGGGDWEDVSCIGGGLGSGGLGAAWI
jgi:hypothetical protein